jgi:DnaK suppressor protein
MLLLVAMIATKTFKEKLEAEKSQLEEQLSGIARLNEATDVWEVIPDQDLVGEIDDNDAADRFEDFEERSATANTLQARLKDINAALAKIAAGTYGICEVEPKHEIEIARLEANPAARTCKEHMNAS